LIECSRKKEGTYYENISNLADNLPWLSAFLANRVVAYILGK